MSNNENKVDVLAVLRDEYVAMIALSAMVHPSKCDEVRARADKINEVRAAVAELVEALRSAREWHLGDKYRVGTEDEQLAWRDQLARYDAALACFGGAS